MRIFKVGIFYVYIYIYMYIYIYIHIHMHIYVIKVNYVVTQITVVSPSTENLMFCLLLDLEICGKECVHPFPNLIEMKYEAR